MKKIVLFLVLFALVVGGQAQEVSELDVQKMEEVNKIKLSEQTMYANAVADFITDDNEAVSLAHQQSIALLQTHVIEIFAKYFRMNREDVREIWDVIDDKCQNVEIRRGDLLKVFSYVTKDAFKSFLGKKKIKPLTPEDSLILYGKPETDITDIIPSQPEPGPQPQPEPGPEPEPQPKPQPQPKPEPIVTPEFCKEILGIKNQKDIIAFLNKEKVNGNLIFGPKSKMQHYELCYVVITEMTSGNIVTVLDKGNDERLNFVTMQKDRLSNYKNGGYAAIFVQKLDK